MNTNDLHPGDILVVKSVNRETGELEIVQWLKDESVTMMRLENAHGQVVYMSREEYEGRRNGTWAIDR